jgi:chemotaxis protein methyltransferase CheR
MEPVTMSDQEDILFLQWALPKLGYRWSGFKKPRNQVIKRIHKRISELKLTGGYSEYRAYLERHPEEWKKLDKYLFVTISRFFRDRKLWEFIRDEILKGYIISPENKTVDIWSAGCCNGEEPYTMAIILDQISKQSGKTIPYSILATDRKTELIDRAKRGIYPEGALKELTSSEKKSCFSKQSNRNQSEFKIDERLSNFIEFEIRDIRQSIPDRQFDLIFCRNLVFTYFDTSSQQEFLQRLFPQFKDNGFLVIGNNEKLPSSGLFRKLNNRHPVYQVNRQYQNK